MEGRDGKGKGVGKVLRGADEVIKGDESTTGGNFKLSYLRYNELEYVISFLRDDIVMDTFLTCL